MKALLQVLLRRAGGYELYRVLLSGPRATPLPLPEGWTIAPVDNRARTILAGADDAKPRELAGAGLVVGALFLALWSGADLLGVVLYEPAELSWVTGFWPRLRGRHALVDLWTMAEHRRRGAGQVLLSHSAARFETAPIAWTWWTNRPALRTFARCGWVRQGWMGGFRGQRGVWPREISGRDPDAGRDDDAIAGVSR